VAVAESFTGGLVAHALVATEGSGEWLRGGIVAYDAEVKFSLLGVPRGPVVNARTARTMARAVAALLAADVGVATTGVAGPEPPEDRPPGTAWLAVATPALTVAAHVELEGPPARVAADGACVALDLLALTLRRVPPPT
jgi:PncC family amidohydrolase